jgi:hypothetical protein
VFLTLVQEQHGHLTGVLHALASGGGEIGACSTDLQMAVERVAQLWSAAQQINASEAMTFFMGLHSFLTIVLQQRVVISAQSVEAVALRLSQCVHVIEEWVESGRVERSAIQEAIFH